MTFRPSPGKILQYHPPGGLGVRIDFAVYQGYVIPPYYDSLVGKLIVHGKTRGECLMRLRRALDEMVVEGIETTLPLFRALVREPAIIDGDYHIHWLEQYLAGKAAAERTLPPPGILNLNARELFVPTGVCGPLGPIPRGTARFRCPETLVTSDATRRRAIGQILLLAAGFLVLVVISASSVILVTQAREDSGWVVHTVEVENQINTLLLQIRRAESAARGYLLTSEPRFLARTSGCRCDHPSRRRQACKTHQRQSRSGRKQQAAASRRSRLGWRNLPRPSDL